MSFLKVPVRGILELALSEFRQRNAYLRWFPLENLCEYFGFQVKIADIEIFDSIAVEKRRKICSDACRSRLINFLVFLFSCTKIFSNLRAMAWVTALGNIHPSWCALTEFTEHTERDFPRLLLRYFYPKALKKSTRSLVEFLSQLMFSDLLICV